MGSTLSNNISGSYATNTQQTITIGDGVESNGQYNNSDLTVSLTEALNDINPGVTPLSVSNIKILKGNYTLSGDVFVDKKVTITGSGLGTKIDTGIYRIVAAKTGSGGNVSNISFKDMELDSGGGVAIQLGAVSPFATSPLSQGFLQRCSFTETLSSDQIVTTTLPTYPNTPAVHRLWYLDESGSGTVTGTGSDPINGTAVTISSTAGGGIGYSGARYFSGATGTVNFATNLLPQGRISGSVSATWAAGEATINFADHRYGVGDYVFLTGMTPFTGYNGTYKITSRTVNSFKYALAVNPGGVSTGTARFPNFTIETIMQFDTDTATRILIGQSNSTGGAELPWLAGWTFGFVNSGQLVARIAEDGGTYRYNYISSLPSTGTWHHVVFVYLSTSNVFSIYVDGIAQSTALVSSGTIQILPSIPYGDGMVTRFMSTGRTAATHYWDAVVSNNYLDHVAIWYTNLTPPQIYDRYLRQLAKLDILNANTTAFTITDNISVTTNTDL